MYAGLPLCKKLNNVSMNKYLPVKKQAACCHFCDWPRVKDPISVYCELLE